MTNLRSRVKDIDEPGDVADLFADQYHVPVVGLLLAFMLWIRVRSWENFVVDGEVLFSGNDAWYHYRTVTYTVEHWPATMPFDPWTYFPYGNASGQFGTLYDQIIATAAIVVGLGSPDQQTVAMTLLFTPAVFGVLAAVVAYFAGRRLGGRIGGIVTVLVLATATGTAVVPGSFFVRSSVGFSDHHVAEALFQTLSILGVMVAVTVAQREKPIYEQLLERDFASLRPTLAWSALAGVAMTLYMWVWPFGVLVYGIVGTFLLAQMCVAVVHGRSPEHVAIAGAVATVVSGLTVTASFTTVRITASEYSLLQPVLAFTVAIGCVFMAWLAREWEDRNLDPKTYPVAIVGIVLAIAAFAAVVTPDLYGYFVNQFLRIFGLGFTTSQAGSTVGEVQPLVAWGRQGLSHGIDQLFTVYGFAVFVALFGGASILARQFWSDDVPAQHLLVAVWAVFLTAMTFTQARFQYYLVFPVAILTGYGISVVIDWMDFSGDLRDIETFQALGFAAILIVLLMPVAPAAASAGSNVGPGQSVQAWGDSLEWMQENTPEEGTFNGSERELEYYGTYPRVDDHDYEAGAYGVLSWWDYGHWITAIGERIPNANPFQQGSTTAANFLLAPNESQANDVLRGMSEDDAQTRYVMVDYKMVDTYKNYRGKFFAPTQFYNASDVSERDYTQRIYYNVEQAAYFRLQSQQYYNSTVVRLYQHHGSAVEPQPIVVDWGTRQLQNGAVVPVAPAQGQQSPVRQFRTMEAARAYVENDTSGTARIGGFGGNPSQRVPAMEHYRLVGASDRSASQNGNYNRGVLSTAQGLFGSGAVNVTETRADCATGVTAGLRSGGHLCLTEQGASILQPSEPRWTKVFERVPGATIEGTAPANSTVRAAVQMQYPNSDETFVYHQRAQVGEDGEFTMTVPYSTTGYDEWGPESGHTNVSVRANSSYQFAAMQEVNGQMATVGLASANVTEGQVIGENETATTVDIEPIQTSAGDAGSGSQDGSGTESQTGSGTDSQDGSGTSSQNGSGTASQDVSARAAADGSTASGS